MGFGILACFATFIFAAVAAAQSEPKTPASPPVAQTTKQVHTAAEAVNRRSSATATSTRFEPARSEASLPTLNGKQNRSIRRDNVAVVPARRRLSRSTDHTQIRFLEDRDSGLSGTARAPRKGDSPQSGRIRLASTEEDLGEYILPADPPETETPPRPGRSLVGQEELPLPPLSESTTPNEAEQGLEFELRPATGARVFPSSRVSTTAPWEDDQRPITLPEDHNARDPDPQPSAAGSQGDLLLQSARNAIRLQRMNLAITRFTEYLRRYPDDADARLELASALANAGRSDAASLQMEHLLKQFPASLPLLRRYADMQIQLSNFPKAEVALNELLQHETHRIDAAVDLARVLAWTNRLREAANIYYDILRDVELNDPHRQLRFAELLIDIRRPAEALELLLPLYSANKTELRVLKLIVIASARAGSSLSTVEYISRLETIGPENLGVRSDLAETLFQGGFFRESLMVDQQVLAFEPTHLDSSVRSSLANLRLYEVVAAKSILDSIPPSKHTSKYSRALAEYHSVAGNHADAIAICQRILSFSSADLKTRATLGHAFHRAGQLRRASSAFARVAEGAGARGDPQLRLEAQVAQARVLADAKRFDEAVAILDQAAANGANSDAILEAYVDVLTKGRRYSAAIELIRSELVDAGDTARRVHRLRDQLGLLLARRGDYPEAIHELTSRRSTGQPSAEAVYGTYQAHRMLGNATAAQQVLNTHLGVLASNTYLRVRIAEFATEDCDCCLARQLLQPLDRMCAGNPLISNRLGEACLQCASCEGVCDCVGYFINTLNHAASNVQAMLGLARLYSRRGDYQRAHLYYDRALRHMHDDTNLVREVARMQGQWKGVVASMPIYGQALELASGAHLIASAMNNPERVPEIEIEYDDLADVSTAISTEMQGKQFVGWRPLSAIQTFEGAAVMEPRNEDALFEIGQAHSRLNRTLCAIEAYERLLCINPCHREAMIAIERNRLEMQPQLHIISRHRDQVGRDELATIDFFTTGALLQFPLGEKDEFLQFGYRRSWYNPPGDRQLLADVATLRLQWKPEWTTLVFGQFDYEAFDFGFEPRVNFDLGARHRYLENAELRVHLRRENVIQNRVSIRRDVHRSGGEIGNLWQPTALLDVDTLYRYWEYSDDNAAHEASLDTRYKLTQGRDQLRWRTALDYITYRVPGAFDRSGALELVEHPYFAPRDFWYVSGGLEYRRYLGCDTFDGANQHWFELYGGGGLDSEGRGYGEARGEFARDFSNRSSLSGYFAATRSGVYDETELGGRLTIRY